MNEASDIEIRAYRPGDEHGIVDLFGRCYGREISLAHWRWKMRSLKPNFDNIWVATVGGRLVGHYAGLPFDAWVDKQRSSAIAGVDAMVEPEMRRRGLLTRMANHAHDSWRRAGVCLAVSLPNEQWGSRTTAVDWVPLLPLRWLVRILRPESMLARRLGVASLARLTSLGAVSRRLPGRPRSDPQIDVQEVAKAPSGLDRVGNDCGVQRCRDSNWVKRRYLLCPSIDYHVLLARRNDDIVGHGVYRLDGSHAAQATVAEIVAHDRAAHASLVAEIERRCANVHADSIRALAVPGTANYRDLRHCGFLPRRAAFVLHYIPLQGAMRSAASVDEWLFQGGDFDVV